jgi:hypothetical protein
MDALSSLYPTNQIGSDGFSWWIGQIESDKKGDFKQSGRYRVRIVGYHPQSCDVVSTDDLPWAMVMMPVTNPHTPGGATSVSDQLGPGIWVVGFFLDNDKQQPMIMGSIGRVANSTTETAQDPTPGQTGCKSFTTYVDDVNKVPFDQDPGSTAKPTPADAGHAYTGAAVEDKKTGAAISSGTTIFVNAKNAQNTTTNPAGKNWCVSVADTCGKETDLANTFKRLLSEMLYETQRNDGKLGTYLVSELSGELYDAIEIGRKYVNKSILVMETFVASVKGFILEKLKAAVKDLINLLIYPNKTGNSLSAVTAFFDEILDDVGCQMADLGDRLANFLEDLIFGYLFEVYKAAACLVDQFIEGIINKIQSLMEELLANVLGPLEDILGAAASAINIIGDTINYVLDLLGISCDGPGKKCSKTTTTCTDCKTDKRDGDFLDDLLKNITDDLFPATGEDWSKYTCDEAYEGTTLTETEVITIGGIQDPVEPLVIQYSISDISVEEGDIAIFTVTRSGYLDVSSSVRYSTRNGSATKDIDYQPANGILGFSPGETSKTISVRTFADTESEIDEDFFMRISRDTPGTITAVASQNVARCIISDSRVSTPTSPTSPPTTPVDPGSPPPPPSQNPVPTVDPPAVTDPDDGDDDGGTTETDPDAKPTYRVTADKNVVKEGEFITYTITTTNVATGTTLFYRLFGTGITPSDIVSNSLSGTCVIENNKAKVIIGIAEDDDLENDETIIFGIVGTGAQVSVIITSDTEGFSDEDQAASDDSSSNIPGSSGGIKSPTFGTPITDPGGGFIEIPVDNPGTPYVEPPVIIITGEGRRAAAIPLLDSDGFLKEVRVTDPGVGYKLNSPTNAKKECIIDSFTMLSPGREYTSEPIVYINGDPDVADAVIQDGKVISVRIKNRSIVFDRYPEVKILGGGGYGARFIPSFACLDPEARVTVGSAKIGTGKYIDCP